MPVLTIREHKAVSVFGAVWRLVSFSFFRPESLQRKLQNSINLFQFLFILSTIVVTLLQPLSALATEKNRDIPNLEQLPEGQTLLLRPYVGKIFYSEDIYALRKNNTLYYSLGDVIDVLGLSVKFDEASGHGRGWFLREDWKISFDLKKGKIISRDQEYLLSEQDIIIEDDINFIGQNKVEEIFGFKFSPDIAQQYIEIDSPHPLPKISQRNRQQKIVGQGNYLNVAELPRQEAQSSWFDMNTADVRWGSRFRRAKNQKPSKHHTALVAVEGQALKHNAYGLVNYDNREVFNSAVMRLSKRSEDAVLLGPLHARSYTLGDTRLAEIPLTGDARQELGFRVSNNKLENTQYETTDIEGDAIPGWDVELYRNGILAATISVDQAGQYEFSNVQLFGGDNNFELFFYGPQGEIRRKEINIPITRSALASQDGVYDVSVSLSDTQTYRKNQAQDDDQGTLHVAARYNKTIGNALTYVGVRHRDVEGEPKTFMAGGFTSLIGHSILDANLGVDEKGSGAVKLAARRNISGWDLVTIAQIQSDDYAVDGEENPQTLRLSTSAQRSFTLAQASTANVFTRGEYSQNANGDSQMSRELGGSYQKGRVNISNTLRYDTIEQSNTGTRDHVDNALSVRANMGKLFVRGGINYDILPERKIDRYMAQVNYRPNNKISGDVMFTHDPDRSFSEARLNFNYTNDYFRASPFVEVDTNNELNAGVNFNFSVIDAPHQAMPLVTSDRVVGRGLVSSFVYHDKNGNRIFDADDEPLPDVVVESVNVRRRAETNDRGYSLINNLPTTRATDIHLDEETLPDSFMVAGFEGVSVLPNAGEVTALEFPVHLSGEIDGTISIEKKNGDLKPIRRAAVNLYPLNKGNKKVIKTAAAFDGFYVASQIPPGRYLMAVSNETSKNNKAAASAPKIINIGYDGETLYGHNFKLKDKEVNVPIEVSYLSDDKNIENDKILYAIKMAPNKRSKLLSLLGRMRTDSSSEDLLAGLTTVSFNVPDADEYKRFLTPSNDLEGSYQKCQQLSERALPCSLEVIVPAS